MKKLALVTLAVASQAALSYAYMFEAAWLLDLTNGLGAPMAIVAWASAGICWMIYDWAFKGADTVDMFKIFQAAVAIFAAAPIGMQLNHEPVVSGVQLLGFILSVVAGLCALAALAEFSTIGRKTLA